MSDNLISNECVLTISNFEIHTTSQCSFCRYITKKPVKTSNRYKTNKREDLKTKTGIELIDCVTVESGRQSVSFRSDLFFFFTGTKSWRVRASVAIVKPRRDRR